MLTFPAADDRPAVDDFESHTKTNPERYAEDDNRFGKSILLQSWLYCVDRGADLPSFPSQPLGRGLTVYPVRFCQPSGWTAWNAIDQWAVYAF